MMPLWIYLLVKLAFNSDISIAWTNLIAALVLIVLPTGLGLYIRHHNTEYKIKDMLVWQWIEKITKYVSMCVVCFGVRGEFVDTDTDADTETALTPPLHPSSASSVACFFLQP